MKNKTVNSIQRCNWSIDTFDQMNFVAMIYKLKRFYTINDLQQYIVWQRERVHCQTNIDNKSMSISWPTTQLKREKCFSVLKTIR